MTTSQNTENTSDLDVHPAMGSEGPSSDSGFGTNVGEAVSQQWRPTAERGLNYPAQGMTSEMSGFEDERRLPCNVGRREQAFRIGLGTAMLAAATVAPLSRGWRIALGVVGAAELITGAIRYCPVNQAIGRNSCAAEE